MKRILLQIFFKINFNVLYFSVPFILSTILNRQLICSINFRRFYLFNVIMHNNGRKYVTLNYHRKIKFVLSVR